MDPRLLAAIVAEGFNLHAGAMPGGAPLTPAGASSMTVERQLELLQMLRERGAKSYSLEQIDTAIAVLEAARG